MNINDMSLFQSNLFLLPIMVSYFAFHIVSFFGLSPLGLLEFQT